MKKTGLFAFEHTFCAATFCASHLKNIEIRSVLKTLKKMFFS